MISGKMRVFAQKNDRFGGEAQGKGKMLKEMRNILRGQGNWNV